MFLAEEVTNRYIKVVFLTERYNTHLVKSMNQNLPRMIRQCIKKIIQPPCQTLIKLIFSQNIRKR